VNLIKIINPSLVAVEFKVVELYHNSEPILLCGDPTNRLEHFHYKILEKYLKANRIEFDSFAPDIKYPMSVIPRPKKEGIYEVVGMGYAGIDVPMRYFQLPYGSSRDYRIGVDNEFHKTLKDMFENRFECWEEIEQSLKK